MAVCALLNACSELCRVDMDASHTTFCDSGVCNGLQVEHLHEHSPRHSAGFRTLCHVPDTMFTAPSQLRATMLFDLRAQARTFQAVATFHRLCYAFEHEGVWSIPRRCSLIMRSHNMQTGQVNLQGVWGRGPRRQAARPSFPCCSCTNKCTLWWVLDCLRCLSRE